MGPKLVPNTYKELREWRVVNYDFWHFQLVRVTEIERYYGLGSLQERGKKVRLWADQGNEKETASGWRNVVQDKRMGNDQGRCQRDQTNRMIRMCMWLPEKKSELFHERKDARRRNVRKYWITDARVGTWTLVKSSYE